MLDALHGLEQILNELFSTNPLWAMIMVGVLLFFWSTVLGAIASCFFTENPDATKRRPIHGLVRATNFNYVATIVAGLVLTAATGALGVQPSSKLPSLTGQKPDAQATAPSQDPKEQTVDPQKQAFQLLCGYSYITLGIVCLLVFVIPTASNHDLVKTVGLTTLGFAATIIGGLTGGKI